jgi:hypothetical protein
MWPGARLARPGRIVGTVRAGVASVKAFHVAGASREQPSLLPAYESQCRAAYAAEYTTTIDIRELSDEPAAEPTSAYRDDRPHRVTHVSPAASSFADERT